MLFAEQLNASEGRQRRHRWRLGLLHFPFSVAGSGLCPGWGGQPEPRRKARAVGGLASSRAGLAIVHGMCSAGEGVWRRGEPRRPACAAEGAGSGLVTASLRETLLPAAPQTWLQLIKSIPIEQPFHKSTLEHNQECALPHPFNKYVL